MNTITRLLPLLRGTGHPDAKRDAYGLLLPTVLQAVRRKARAQAEKADADEIAHDVLADFLLRAQIGGWQRLENRSDVEQILACKALDTLIARRRRTSARKRGGDVSTHSLSDDAALNHLSADEIAAIDYAEVTEAIDAVYAHAPSPLHRQLLELLLQGNTQKECADALRVTVRTVQRKLAELKDYCMKCEDVGDAT
jgi:DNA-directed RNA polymerase specialized sigma24 family protein